MAIQPLDSNAKKRISKRDAQGGRGSGRGTAGVVMTPESDPFVSPRVLTAHDVAAASGCLHRWYLDCHAEPDPRNGKPADERQEDAFKRHCLSWLPDVREPSWGSGDEGRL